jgi:hypothetical protein
MGNNWQKAALGALWGVLMLLGSVAMANAHATQIEQAKVIGAQAERIARLEASIEDTRESLHRIEDGVNELRRELRR